MDLAGLRLTSVSLRKNSFELLKAAQRALRGRDVYLSEQEIFRALIRLYLTKWRGAGCKTSSLRRYNVKGKDYVVKPLYLELALSAAAWSRAIHSGVSISRMLDFAIRHYLQIFVQNQLHQEGSPACVKIAINYQCKTWKNSGRNLKFAQWVDYGLPFAMPP